MSVVDQHGWAGDHYRVLEGDSWEIINYKNQINDALARQLRTTDELTERASVFVINCFFDAYTLFTVPKKLNAAYDRLSSERQNPSAGDVDTRQQAKKPVEEGTPAVAVLSDSARTDQVQRVDQAEATGPGSSESFLDRFGRRVGKFIQDNVDFYGWQSGNGYGFTITTKGGPASQMRYIGSQDDLSGPIKVRQKAYDDLHELMKPVFKELADLDKAISDNEKRLDQLEGACIPKATITDFEERLGVINGKIDHVLNAEHKKTKLPGLEGKSYIIELDGHKVKIPVQHWGDEAYVFGDHFTGARKAILKDFYCAYKDRVKSRIQHFSDSYYNVNILNHYKNKNWSGVIEAFNERYDKSRYGNHQDVFSTNNRSFREQAGFENKLYYAIAQQKLHGVDSVSLEEGFIRSFFSSDEGKPKVEENMGLFKQYVAGLLSDQAIAKRNEPLVTYCYEKSYGQVDSFFWLASTIYLKVQSGELSACLGLLNRWIKDHPEHGDADIVKFTLGKLQYLDGDEGAGHKILATISDEFLRQCAQDTSGAPQSAEKIHDTSEYSVAKKTGGDEPAAPKKQFKAKVTAPQFQADGIKQQRDKNRRVRRQLVAEEMSGAKGNKLKKIAADAVMGQVGSQLRQRRNPKIKRSQLVGGEHSASTKNIQAPLDGLRAKLRQHAETMIDDAARSQEFKRPEMKSTGTQMDASADFKEDPNNIGKLSCYIDYLLGRSDTSERDFMAAFDAVDLVRVIDSGDFQRFHEQFVALCSMGKITGENAGRYRARVEDIIKGGLDILGAETVNNKFSYNAKMTGELIWSLIQGGWGFRPEELQRYASQYQGLVRDPKCSACADIDSIRVSADEMLANSNECVEKARSAVRDGHKYNMQLVEVLQYTLDKFAERYPGCISRELYIKLDSFIEVWSRYHEFFSNEGGVWSGDAVETIMPGILMLLRNYMQHQYLSSDEQHRFENFRNLVVADVAALSANVYASRSFFFGYNGIIKPDVGSKVVDAAGNTIEMTSSMSSSLSRLNYAASLTTGLLYLSYYTAMVGTKIASWWQDHAYRSLGRYDDSWITATLSGVAKGVAENPVLSNRVLFGGFMSFLGRVDIVATGALGASFTVTGLITEQMISAGIMEVVVENGVATVALSSAASTVLLGANIATAALLAHDAYQYATLIHGDNELENLMLDIKRAEQYEKDAEAYKAAGDHSKASASMAKAHEAYKGAEEKFTHANYDLNYSEQLHLKQELGRMYGMLGKGSGSEEQVFDEAMGVLKNDTMFNREKGWGSWFVRDPHRMYKDDQAREIKISQYCKLAEKAFLKTNCTLAKNCADKIELFEKETGELILTEEQKTFLHHVADNMKIHMLTGETNDFVQHTPSGLFYDCKKQYDKLSADISATILYDEKRNQAKRYNQALADLHFSRFPWADDQSREGSLAGFLVHKLSKVCDYLQGGDAGLREKYKKYNEFGEQFVANFILKEMRYDLFYVDTALRYVIPVMLTKLFAFSPKGSAWPKRINVGVLLLREYWLRQILDRMSEVRKASLAGWLNTRRDVSYAVRLVNPLLSLLMPNTNQPDIDPNVAINALLVVFAQSLCTAISFLCYMADMLVAGLNFSTNPLMQFLGVIFSAQLCLSQIHSLTHGVFQVEGLKRIAMREQVDARPTPSVSQKLLKVLQNNRAYSALAATSSLYHFYSMYPDLCDILNTYEITRSWALWPLQPFMSVFEAEPESTWLSMFAPVKEPSTFENFLACVGAVTAAQATALACTLIVIMLGRLIYDFLTMHEGAEEQVNPGHFSQWMAWLDMITHLNLSAHFNKPTTDHANAVPTAQAAEASAVPPQAAHQADAQSAAAATQGANDPLYGQPHHPGFFDGAPAPDEFNAQEHIALHTRLGNFDR